MEELAGRDGEAIFDLSASKLAGLHVHFFLATAEHAAKDDIGVYRDFGRVA